MNLQHRIELLEKLGKYILADNVDWKQVKDRAARENPWFIPEFISLASGSVATQFLHGATLQKFASDYTIPAEIAQPKKVGIIMAGNLPLVGFHDFLCVFLSGHRQLIKPSSKDAVLIRHLVEKLAEWDPQMNEYVAFSEMLKGCDAYIATGSNNTSRYFEQYFGKYPNIIRRNRTSVAILDGTETPEELDRLADDVYQYFGLGCRNVTKIYVPQGYEFLPLLDAFRKYDHLADFHKYKNNYDYQLAVLIINKKYYMTNGSVILYEEASPFSPISQLNYSFYNNREEVTKELEGNSDIQAIVGRGFIPFGQAQLPTVTDFADGVDTLKFLLDL
jgi:hypothetical protein